MRMGPVLFLPAIVFAAPPAANAWELDGSRWASKASGLTALLTRMGDSYELRSQSGSTFEALFGNVPPRGTLLLRMRLAGNEFAGTGFAFAPGCTFSYQVTGRLAGNTLEWSGMEPRDREHGTCRVTRRAYATYSLRLLSAALPIPAPVPLKPAPSVRPPPTSGTTSSIRQSIREWRENALAAVSNFISAATPAPPKLPELEFPTSVPMLIALAMGSVIALALGAFMLSFITLRLMAVLAEARVALAERRSHLASVAPSRAAGFSGDELQRILDTAFPDIEEEQRRAIARTIAAAIRDKGSS